MFFIPFVVTIKTHYNSLSKVFVYLITYVFLDFLLVFLQNFHGGVLAPDFVLKFSLAFVSFVNLYEIGYIWNETETIKTEVAPTKRLSISNLSFYEKNKHLIYLERFLLSVVLNFCLSFLVDAKSLLAFSLSEALMLVVYFVYNSVRGKYSQIVYFFLSGIKYLAVPMCFLDNLSVSVLVSGILMFPLIRTLEYKAHYGLDSDVNIFFRKHVIKYDVTKITDFRFYASGLIFIAMLLLYLCDILDHIPLICCGYMFLYRASLMITIKKGAVFKDYLKR